MLQEDKQSLLLDMVGVLGYLTPQEEVVELSQALGEPAEAQSFVFEVDREGELLVEAAVEDLLEQIIEEPVPVEQSPVLTVEEATPTIISSPPRAKW